MTADRVALVRQHVERLTAGPDRRPGSPANDRAVDYAAEVLRGQGWVVDTPSFPVVAWTGGRGGLRRDGQVVEVHPSPYGLPVECRAPLVPASSVAELEGLRTSGDAHGAVLLLDHPLTDEPLNPAEFPFFDLPEHDRIRALLADCAPAAIVSVTGRRPDLCAAMDPFPYVQDGSFPLPVADVRPSEAGPLRAWADARVPVDLLVEASRWPARARNVVAVSSSPARRRSVVVAHIDTVPGTPGALDNAGGVATILTAAAELAGVEGADAVEVLAVNGEDYYAASGEVAWLAAQRAEGRSLDDVALAVNVDGAGAVGRRVEWSGYLLDDAEHGRVETVMAAYGLRRGEPWWQSDHAVFAQAGRPAVALTSEGFEDLLDSVCHSPADTTDRVDPAVLTDAAAAIATLVRTRP